MKLREKSETEQVRQAKEEQKLYFTYKNIHPISTIQ